jgi:hypothetical protein
MSPPSAMNAGSVVTANSTMSLANSHGSTVHMDPVPTHTSNHIEPDATGSVTSSRSYDPERRELPFPPMRQIMDAEKQRQLRELTQAHDDSRLGNNNGSRAPRSHHSNRSGTTSSSVKPYRGPPTVEVAGVSLGTLTCISPPMRVDPLHGAPVVQVGLPSATSSVTKEGDATLGALTPVAHEPESPLDSAGQTVTVVTPNARNKQCSPLASPKRGTGGASQSGSVSPTAGNSQRGTPAKPQEKSQPGQSPPAPAPQQQLQPQQQQPRAVGASTAAGVLPTPAEASGSAAPARAAKPRGAPPSYLEANDMLIRGANGARSSGPSPTAAAAATVDPDAFPPLPDAEAAFTAPSSARANRTANNRRGSTSSAAHTPTSTYGGPPGSTNAGTNAGTPSGPAAGVGSSNPNHNRTPTNGFMSPADFHMHNMFYQQAFGTHHHHHMNAGNFPAQDLQQHFHHHQHSAAYAPPPPHAMFNMSRGGAAPYRSTPPHQGMTLPAPPPPGPFARTQPMPTGQPLAPHHSYAPPRSPGALDSGMLEAATLSPGLDAELVGGHVNEPLSTSSAHNGPLNLSSTQAAMSPNHMAWGMVESAVMEMLTNELEPSFAELKHRHEVVSYVVNSVYRQALSQVIPGLFDLRFCIFGSVQSRTCLPDGDNDVAVFVQIHKDDPRNKSLIDVHGQPTTTGADLIAKARDHIHSLHTNVTVDSLVFAEVRVLKLLFHGQSIDLTADMIGGYTAAAFVTEIDMRIGHRHVFRHTLVLLKAWALHEARILGSAGGYLSTYSLIVMLVAVFNDLDAKVNLADYSPLRIAHYFLDYYSAFKFDEQCVTIYGAVPATLEAITTFIDQLHTAFPASVAQGHQPTATTLTPPPSVLSGSASDSQFNASPPTTETASPNPTIAAAAANGPPATLNLGSSIDTLDNVPTGPSPVVTSPVMDQPSAALPSPSVVSPSSAQRLPAFHAAKIGQKAVTKCLDKYAGKPKAATADAVAAPLFTPSVASTQSAPVQHSVLFPVRHLNVMDPLKPHNNLSRGVSQAHLYRIGAAFAHGLETLNDALQRCASQSSPQPLFQMFLPNTMDLLAQHGPRHDRAHFDRDACRCHSCPEPTVFCTDMRKLAQMAAEVTMSPHGITEATSMGYEAAHDEAHRIAEHISSGGAANDGSTVGSAPLASSVNDRDSIASGSSSGQVQPSRPMSQVTTSSPAVGPHPFHPFNSGQTNRHGSAPYASGQHGMHGPMVMGPGGWPYNATGNMRMPHHSHHHHHHHHAMLSQTQFMQPRGAFGGQEGYAFPLHLHSAVVMPHMHQHRGGSARGGYGRAGGNHDRNGGGRGGGEQATTPMWTPQQMPPGMHQLSGAVMPALEVGVGFSTHVSKGQQLQIQADQLGVLRGKQQQQQLQQQQQQQHQQQMSTAQPPKTSPREDTGVGSSSEPAAPAPVAAAPKKQPARKRQPAPSASVADNAPGASPSEVTPVPPPPAPRTKQRQGQHQGSDPQGELPAGSVTAETEKAARQAQPAQSGAGDALPANKKNGTRSGKKSAAIPETTQTAHHELEPPPPPPIAPPQLALPITPAAPVAGAAPHHPTRTAAEVVASAPKRLTTPPGSPPTSTAGKPNVYVPPHLRHGGST